MKNPRKTVINFLATGAGIGLLPKMPGTFGTLWGIAVVYLISGSGTLAYIGFSVALFIAACLISSEAEKNYGSKDPSKIIIDEIVGFTVAFFLVKFTLVNVIIVFLLFRFFDIVKPFPVNYLDRRLQGGTGIVLDDVAAGVYANISMQVIVFCIM